MSIINIRHVTCSNVITHTLCLVGVVLIAGLINCSQQRISNFNRIDNDKIRVIGMQFLPAPEAAPGDTLSARILFAGNTAANVDVGTFSIQYTFDEQNFIAHEQPLTIVRTTSWLPDSFEFSFIIPDSIFLDAFHTTYGLDTTDSIALKFMSTPVAVRAYLDSLSLSQREQTLLRVRSMGRPFSVFCNAMSDNGSTLKIMGECGIRYNARFPELLPINNNPRLDWIAVYQVLRSQAMNFNPYDIPAGMLVKKSFLLNVSYPDSIDTTITIDTGYTYFFVADNGLRQGSGSVDTIRDIDIGRDGKAVRESYSCRWFYQNIDNPGTNFDSLLLIDNTTNTFCEFRPPLNVSMQRFKIWASLYDNLPPSRFYRPVGMAFKGIKASFIFTDAYKQAMGQVHE